MEELLSSHAKAIEDLKEMPHRSHLVALHAFSAISDIYSSRCKVMFDALGFEEHEVSQSTSTFFDRNYGLLQAAVQRTWEREMLHKLAPHVGDKPHNRLPRKCSRTR